MTESGNANDRFMRFSIAMETISKNVQKYKNEQLAPFGLKSMHLMLLYCLGQAVDGLTATELSKNCGVDKAFISRMAADLRTMGYISYAEEDDGQYRKRLTLTGHGREIIPDINCRISSAVEKVTADIPREHLEVFYSVLEKMNGNINGLLEDAEG
ncbi:MAG: MarR family transcriptional regulator [Clostridia bacterium]|nr:MarR family transcriptional regulator [Clostridia bacterium]